MQVLWQQYCLSTLIATSDSRLCIANLQLAHVRRDLHFWDTRHYEFCSNFGLRLTNVRRSAARAIFARQIHPCITHPHRKRNCRFRFVRSIVSMSMTCISRKPLKARPFSSSHPRPPAPRTRTFASLSRLRASGPGENSPFGRVPVSLAKWLAPKHRASRSAEPSEGAAPVVVRGRFITGGDSIRCNTNLCRRGEQSAIGSRSGLRGPRRFGAPYLGVTGDRPFCKLY